jgi:replicative DNA helicase
MELELKIGNDTVIVEADSLINGKYDKVLYDKFIEAYEVNDYEVLTPNGWVNIEGIGKTIEFEEYKVITFNDKELICADTHILFRCDNLDILSKKCDLTEIFTKDLQLGDFIMTKDGPEMVMELYKTGNSSNMYDLQLSEGSNKQFYTNDILSHNSLWMQNLAVASANMGSNVLYVTLEMSERKVLKRLGAMRLKIPVNEYDEISKDTEFMQKKIDNLKKSAGGGSDLFEKKIGKIYTRFWAAGTANVNDIDNYVQKLKDRKGIKIDLIIVDYLTLMVPPGKANGSDTLYIKGKVLAEGLRALGSKYKCPVISALQVAKDAWNSSNISLESVPESKAIPETADTFFAIIRNEEMKRQNLYRLKMLKQRDGDFSKSQIRINLNPTYLNLEGDQFIDA